MDKNEYRVEPRPPSSEVAQVETPAEQACALDPPQKNVEGGTKLPSVGTMRVRRVCFTVYDEVPVEFDPEWMRYMLVKRRKCPTTDRVHWRSYIELKTQTALTMIRVRLVPWHVEPYRGDTEMNIEYRVKDEMWVEWGEPCQQGKRSHSAAPVVYVFNRKVGGCDVKGAKTTLLPVRELFESSTHSIEGALHTPIGTEWLDDEFATQLSAVYMARMKRVVQTATEAVRGMRDNAKACGIDLDAVLNEMQDE